jgi:hypothetical protein
MFSLLNQAYGHSAHNMNVHVLLTPSHGTAALHAESEPALEDWHPLTLPSYCGNGGGDGGVGDRGGGDGDDEVGCKEVADVLVDIDANVGNGGAVDAAAILFDGARVLHWTPENTTQTTRVSLDFRLALFLDEQDDGCGDGDECDGDNYGGHSDVDAAKPSAFVAGNVAPTILPPICRGADGLLDQFNVDCNTYYTVCDAFGSCNKSEANFVCGSELDVDYRTGFPFSTAGRKL